MRGPLTVVLSNGTTTRHITSHVSDVRFKRSAFGGDVDLTCSLTVSRDVIAELGPTWCLSVYDSRTAALMWQGDLTNPGYNDGSAGQSYSLQAFGGAGRLTSMTVSLCYVDQTLDEWERSGNSTKHAETNQDEKGEDNPTLEVAASKQESIGTDWQGEWIYRALKRNGLKCGRLRADYDAGITNGNYNLTLRSGTDNSSLGSRDSATASTGGGTLRATLDGSINTGDNVFAIRADRSSSSITATKDHWFRFAGVTVRQMLKDKFGANILTGYTGTTANTVFAHQVIADMLGRGMAPGAEPAKATIATTTFAIDQLAWLDGITMADALQALQVFETDLYWTLYANVFTAGLWDDVNVRYIVSRRDGGIDLPGQSNTLCNRIAVTWTDRKKKEHTTVVTASVPGLNFNRDADPITLPPGTGSEANAQRAGLRALAITNSPPRAGTAVVNRLIFDYREGRLVCPHEIMPGCSVMEQESGHIFRLTEVEYVAADAAATLTLGDPVRSIEQMLAHLRDRSRRK